jgi:hypothetical protein
MRFWGARACGNRLSLRIRFQLPTSGVPKLTNRPSAIKKWTTHLEQILLSRQQQPRPGGDDLEQITRARQAAEALFRSKPPVSGPSVPASAPADQSARKPRALQIISPAMPVRHEERETPAAPEQTMRKIPRSQFVRIRTLLKYGMTVAPGCQGLRGRRRRDRQDFVPGLTAKIRFRDHSSRRDCPPPQPSFEGWQSERFDSRQNEPHSSTRTS